MPCPSFLSFPSATSSSHTPAGWPGGGVMPPIRDVLLPWLRLDSSSRRISLRRFLNALYACFRSSSVAISRSPGNLFNFDMRPHRSEYRGSSTHENRIVQSGGDFPSTAFPDRTDDRTGRSIVAGRPAGILRRHAGESSRIAGTSDSWNWATVAIFETETGFLPLHPT